MTRSFLWIYSSQTSLIDLLSGILPFFNRPKKSYSKESSSSIKRCHKTSFVLVPNWTFSFFSFREKRPELRNRHFTPYKDCDFKIIGYWDSVRIILFMILTEHLVSSTVKTQMMEKINRMFINDWWTWHSSWYDWRSVCMSPYIYSVVEGYQVSDRSLYLPFIW